MAAKKTTTNKATTTPKAATKKATAAKADAPKAKKLSQLDAAAKVLAESGEPMNAKSMVEAMGAKGYWTSPGGKTPHSTLYAAIIREINTKGQDARFVKHDRGLFGLNGGATTKASAKAKGSPKASAKKAVQKKSGNAKPADGTPGPQAVSELFTI